jgi:hypothetical protein
MKKVAPKAQLGKLIKKGVKAAEEIAPKIETSTMKNVVKKVSREDLKSKMKQWDTDLLKGKKKMKNGGSLSGLKVSNKRVGSEKGAWITVQNKALAGAKGKASLTKDKQLGATKMAKRGMSVKKK